jgi:predicted Rossmann fold nucleotide-binding protein DprA/Smf involved in DNA uptake
VQLNSLDRPGTCSWVEPTPIEVLQDIARAFAPLPVEILTRQAQTLPSAAETADSSVLSLLARRPSTIEEIAVFTGLTINQVKPLLSSLVDTKAISAHSVGNRTFFRPC